MRSEPEQQQPMKAHIALSLLAAGFAHAGIIYGPTEQSIAIDIKAARPQTPDVPHGQFEANEENNTPTDWSDSLSGSIEFVEFDPMNYMGSAQVASQSTFAVNSFSYAAQTAVAWNDFGGSAVGYSSASGRVSFTFQVDAPMYYVATADRGVSGMTTQSMTLTGPTGVPVFSKEFNIRPISETGWLTENVNYTLTIQFGESPVFGLYDKGFTSSFNVSAVPEPGETTAVVALACAGGFFLLRRRSRR